MAQQKSSKYTAFPPVGLTDRQWPSRVITQAPIWMSTDLRDGNQALFEPMNADKKMQMFQTLCAIGFKEIEVAFPSASETEFGFVRRLIDDKHIPDDVTIEVLTQAREHLIRRTFESLKGAKQAIVHVYNATCPSFRDFVFGMSKAEVVTMAVDAVKLIKSLAEQMPETKITLEYSPELFTATELDFAKEVCDAVTAAWGATPDNKVILNLPTTVEIATPNIYADQIEWMHRNLARRDSVIISLHPHNDRGTAVAAAELALMAWCRTRRRLPLRQRRAHRQRRPGDARAQHAHPGRRSATRLLRHQRRRPHLRTLHPAPDPSAPPIRRGSRFHGLLRLPPGRHQEGVCRSKGG